MGDDKEGSKKSVPSSVSVVLDITKGIDEKAFQVVRQKPYDIQITTYIPRKGHILTKILEGSSIIWIGSWDDDEKCTKVSICSHNGQFLAHLHTVEPGFSERTSHYMKLKRSWNVISEDVFYERFTRLVFSNSILYPLTLDIGKVVDTFHFFVNRSEKLPFSIYMPTPGYILSRVFDGLTTIWKSNSIYETCAYVSVYPNIGKPLLAHLIIANSKGDDEALFFRKALMRWKPISKDEYTSKLEEVGLKQYELKTTIGFDIIHPDTNKFNIKLSYIANIHTYISVPLPGFKVNRVIDDGFPIWKAKDDEKCVYICYSTDEKDPFLSHLLISDSENNCRLVYYSKHLDGTWTEIDSLKYFSILTNRNDPIYTHTVEEPRLLMSSFKNKDGLRIKTYASRVDDPKGSVILVHGLRSHFRSTFCKYNYNWNCKTFGFPIFPTISTVTNVQTESIYNDLKFGLGKDKYKYFFENTCLDGIDAFSISSRYEYEGSFMECLNRMGYNVYGLDLQSHGLSESQTEKRCYVSDFKDYVYDVLQFVSIVKRGKFGDPNQVYNERTIYKAHSTDAKYHILGSSMGSNIVMQAVQEFHKNAKKEAKFMDSLIFPSGILNVNGLNAHKKKFGDQITKILLSFAPKTDNPLDNPFGYGETFGTYLRFKDPMFFIKRMTPKAFVSSLNAHSYATENMTFYPSYLPALFIDVSGDSIPNARERKNAIYNHLRGRENVKFVEVEGNCHNTIAPQFLSNVAPILNDWLGNIANNPLTEESA
ncbi:conserved hypothetical protein [Theileria equi strain WA]|uniref:Serine aminopeptidase S33 domain-containing protein n=1 Tax=Theileria equi strain WA TaxID=1537102 RepID=L1LD41_THEEQ|nr:conserved hypothetical protein [Theileria equi strain WA]EKX73199.1 conserved hypothetical protein [Theileria equi strain WA]|eukprot:XP_004832651.1 conserved hypothetical protein [Theileria equi strain WA]